MFRRSLFIVAMGLVLGGFSKSAAAQTAPASTPVNPSAQPVMMYDQPALDYGVYDFTSVYARAFGAIAEDRRASMELLMTGFRLQREFHLSSEYKTAAAELEQAHDALEAARKPVLASIAGDPHYQDTLGKYQTVSSVMSEGGLGARDLRDLAQRKMEYGTELRKMESAALGADATVQSAHQRVVAAHQKVDDLHDTFEATLYKNPQWAAAKRAYDRADVSRQAAEGAVYGANLTACLAFNADARRSLYGQNQYGGYPGSFIDPGLYYSRRY